MSKNKILSIIIIFFSLINNSFSQDGKETIVTFPDGTKDIEKNFKYPGGKDSLLKDISDNFIVPKRAKKDKISGKVILKITIDSLGIASGEIISGLRTDVDNAALEMVKKLKKSEPAKQGKKNVSFPLILPLKI
jgi:TonB family protein